MIPSESFTRVKWWIPFSALVHRELLLASRRKADFLNPFFFFVLVITITPLSLGSDPALLAQVGPGMVWLAAVLATLLTLDQLFRSDFQDGSLELLLMSPQSTTLLVGARVLAHWLLTGLPLTVSAPVLGLSLGLDRDGVVVLLITLLLGTPTFSLIGAIGGGTHFRSALFLGSPFGTCTHLGASHHSSVASHLYELVRQ